MMTMDRRAPAPLYHQLKRALIDHIQTAGLAPGARMPTEAEIEQQHGISRTTIRQALQELVQAGVVERVQGRGTFVAAPPLIHAPLLTSFTENMQSQGQRPSHRVLESWVTAAPQAVADALELEPGAPCRFIRRLLLVNDRALGVAETWLPRAVLGVADPLFDAAALAAGSLYEVLQRPPIGLVLARGAETVRAGLADDEQAALLGCSPSAPVLVVDRVSFTADERPVESTRLVFDGTRYAYRSELSRP